MRSDFSSNECHTAESGGMENGRIPRVSTRFSLNNAENEQDDAGRDDRTCLL